MDPQEADRVKATERAKLEAREEFQKQSSADNWKTQFLTWANSSFGLFVLGTVVVGAFGHLYSARQEEQKHRAAIWETAQRNAQPAITEIDYRLRKLAYDWIFSAEPIYQASRGRRTTTRPPIFGENPPKDYPYDAGAGFVMWIEIEPHELDEANLVPRYKGWPFRAVFTELKTSLALLQNCIAPLDRFDAAYTRVETTRTDLENVARGLTDVGQSNNIELEVFFPTTGDGGVRLEDTTISGLRVFLPAGGKIEYRRADVLDELLPLTSVHVALLTEGKALMTSLRSCLPGGPI
jgi:hypothetical protein